jgi:hypothetical protein
VVPDADPLEEALKKRPVRVKAGGKEREVRSIAELEKYVQKGLPIAESLQQLAEERQKLAPFAQALQALQGEDSEQAVAVLEQLMGPRFVRVAEQRLMREIQREKSMEGMTERERSMSAELERTRAERADFEARQRQAQEQAQRAEEERHVTALRQHIHSEVTGALQAIGMPQGLAPQAMALVRPLIEASIRAGQPLDKEVLGQEMRSGITDAVQWATSGLEGRALLDFFGDDMKKRYRAALLAEVRGPAKTPVPVQTQQQGQQRGAEVFDFRLPRR